MSHNFRPLSDADNSATNYICFIDRILVITQNQAADAIRPSIEQALVDEISNFLNGSSAVDKDMLYNCRKMLTEFHETCAAFNDIASEMYFNKYQNAMWILITPNETGEIEGAVEIIPRPSKQ